MTWQSAPEITQRHQEPFVTVQQEPPGPIQVLDVCAGVGCSVAALLGVLYTLHMIDVLGEKIILWIDARSAQAEKPLRPMRARRQMYPPMTTSAPTHNRRQTPR